MSYILNHDYIHVANASAASNCPAKAHLNSRFIQCDNLHFNLSWLTCDRLIVGGDKIPRKGGPGITQSDLLVVNKTDLAEAVGADLQVRHFAAARLG